MDVLLRNKTSKPKQYAISLLLVITVSAVCFAFSSYLDYRVVALLLLVTVSLSAMLFEFFPVLSAATLSALIWDYFFIPPYFTFQVGSVEDRVLLIMYFVVALVNAALTYKLKKMERVAIQREEKSATIRLYNTLLNSLSHELRTPIAAIIGASDNLQSNSNKLTPIQKADLLKEISKASFRLNGQVENLLNVSRLESGFIKPKKDWCDVQELIYDTVYRLDEDKVMQQIHININPTIPLFKTDKGMLEQVLHNLLLNATRYTPADSVIQVMANCYADVLEITIEDSGPGFPEKEMDLVFDKFYRLHNSRTGGTGLGLSIVKGFTEALGGQVYLKNREQGGAQFVLHIPAETSYLKNLKNE